MGLVENIANTLKASGLVRKIERDTIREYCEDKCLEMLQIVGSQLVNGFQIDENNKDVYINLLKYLHNSSDFQALNPRTKQWEQGNLTRGIYIAGPTGVGKSTVFQVLRGYNSLFNFTFRVGTSTYSFNFKDYHTKEICSIFANKGSFDELNRLALVSLQDLGTEPKNSLYMGNRIDVIRELIEERGDDHCKITFISSNYPMLSDYITATYGERVTSRLQTMCNYFELRGLDRRSR